MKMNSKVVRSREQGARSDFNKVAVLHQQGEGVAKLSADPHIGHSRKEVGQSVEAILVSQLANQPAGYRKLQEPNSSVSFAQPSSRHRRVGAHPKSRGP